jgi:hypothetical protein
VPRISLLASRPHYLDHLAPVWHALPEDTRGEVVVRSNDLALHAKKLGLQPTSRTIGRDTAVLTAAWVDSRSVVERLVALLEHGAGQTYSNGHAGYSGGEQRENVSLFLCPSGAVARRNQERYPSARVAVVGCPKLDQYHALTRVGERASEVPVPTVAVTFHWDGRSIAPEARWALPHYRDALPELVAWAAEHDVELLGHGHPRVAAKLQVMWRKLGVPWASADEVLRRAGVLVVDNSSLGMESVALDRGVVWLSAPWYRRDVTHGGRFWSWVETGVHVEDPAQLVDSVEYAIGHLLEFSEARRRAALKTYSFLDDRCARRAVDALLSWTDS